MSEPNGNSQDRESIAQFAFEEFQIPAYFTIKKSILTLFANGRTTGLVFECGASTTQFVPIFEGYTLSKAMVSAPIGGDTITSNIANFIEEKRGKEVLPPICFNYNLDNDGNKEVGVKDLSYIDPSVIRFHKMRYVQDMKELHFKVSTPSDENQNEVINYELPDGTSLSIGSNRYSFAEIFFSDNPVLFE